MINKYFQFLESLNSTNSLGEDIEKLCTKDDYIKMIVSQYTTDTKPSIRLSNAINLLSDFDKKDLIKRIENHLNCKKQSTDISTTASVDFDSVPQEYIQESYGKNVFNTFSKCITALGLKDDISQPDEIPSEFLIYFRVTGIDTIKLQGVFQRFKSLSQIKLDISSESSSLYFGIKCDGHFEYGYYHDEPIAIGSFKLTKSSFNSLKLSTLKSLSKLKKCISDLSLSDVILMSKAKIEMDKFNPGKFEQKMVPQVSDKVISFGYYGVGKWDNGQIDNEYLNSFKSSLKSFLSKYKWSDKFLINLNPNRFWIYINLKVK